MRRLIQTSFQLLCCQWAVAQSTTYLGLEFGPKWDLARVDDPSGVAYGAPFFYRPYFGLSVAQEFLGKFRVESGFCIVNYGESYRIRESYGAGISSGVDSYQIPLRVRARINLGSGKVRLLPMLGYALGFNRNHTSRGTGGGCIGSLCLGQPGPNTLLTRDTTTSRGEVLFNLIQTGIAAEFQIKNGPVFSLSGILSVGTQVLYEQRISYVRNYDAERRARAYYRGSYFAVNVGMGYPLSRIWGRGKDRV